ncbi:hypothetical protein KKR91_03400 [Arthrobacter jiangjiafuii]|uniref:Uncharacterized protein n=1 Tax=Arthrobacter jiangjiafuii TaxID=2817475 RepID=A0A975M654_9MICC|nr:hypothetical protein [Arthrobacter jiangjiafuii]MBP3043649.1 hypothetical protein [Arthrobacter jiangjiafuii]QWC10688.1 hypothetical protein KKR91_03400 [Arthrobacter jiangjiafuii]
MEQQQPHDLEVPSPPAADAPPANAAQPDQLNGGRTGGMGALGITLLVLGNLLYCLTAIPAYVIYALATRLSDESQLHPMTFWMSIGWIISFVAGWAAFYWLHRNGAARTGAAVFFGICVFWFGTSLLPLVIAW